MLSIVTRQVMYVHISVVYDGARMLPRDHSAHVCFCRYAWGIALRLNHGHMFTVRPIIALDKLKFVRIEDEKNPPSIRYIGQSN